MWKCVCENKGLRILVKWVYKQNQLIIMREFVNLNISRSILIDLINNVYSDILITKVLQMVYDTAKRLMSSFKYRNVEVINNPARPELNHMDVNYIIIIIIIIITSWKGLWDVWLMWGLNNDKNKCQC